jgi:hypothetical protein
MQLTKLFTAVAASVAIVNALPTASQEANTAELSAEADAYMSNIAAILYGSVTNTNVRLVTAPNATNSSAPAFPNWEGAIIGAGMAAQLGALIGAALGVFSSWTFVGFQKGLTDLFGFDPLAALASGTLPIPGLDAGKGGKDGLPPFPPSLGGLTAPTPAPPAPKGPAPTPPAKDPAAPAPKAPAATPPAKGPAAPAPPKAPAAPAPKAPAAAPPKVAPVSPSPMGGHAHGA